MNAAWPVGYETRPESGRLDFSDISSWNLTNRCAVELVDSPDPDVYAGQMWKVTPDGTGTLQVRKLGITPLDLSANLFSVRIYVPEDQPGGAFQFIASNSNSSVSNAALFSANANSVRHGWVDLLFEFDNRASASNPIGYSGTTYGTGAVKSSPIQSVEIDYTSPGTTPFYLGHVAAGRRTRPAVVIGFDVEVTQALVDYALPALADAGMVAYLGISFPNGQKLRDTNALNAVAVAAGWYYVFHSRDHVNYTSLSRAQIVDDWTEGLQYMIDGGYFDGQNWDNASYFVYPENGTNAEVIRTMRSLGVKYARSLAHVRNVHGGDILSSTLRQGSVELNSGTSLATAQALVDDAIRCGHLLHLFGHGLTTGAADSLNWNSTDFTNLLAYIKTKKLQGLIDTPTWMDWNKGLTQPTLAAV